MIGAGSGDGADEVAQIVQHLAPICLDEPARAGVRRVRGVVRVTIVPARRLEER